MSKRYIFLSVVFIALAAGLVILPSHEKSEGIQPEILLLEMNSPERYLSPDLVAERIINEDPRIFLVDVRSAYDYDEYHIPGAFNFPLSDVLNDSISKVLNQKYRDIVFYSNGQITADQAWVLYRQKDYKNLYVMEGGLNRWFNEIMMPKMPAEIESNDAFNLYKFRQGASIYFGMNAPEVEYIEPVKTTKTQIAKKAAPKKQVILEPVEEEEEEEEGC